MPKADAFEEFHCANPLVYDVFVAQAREWQASGRAKCGVKMLFERVRWELAIRTVGDDYKINNNHAPFYARLIMAREDDLAGLFNVRSSEADAWMAFRTAE